MLHIICNTGGDVYTVYNIPFWVAVDDCCCRPAIFNFVVVQFFFEKSSCCPVFHINIYGAYFVKIDFYKNLHIVQFFSKKK